MKIYQTGKVCYSKFLTWTVVIKDRVVLEMARMNGVAKASVTSFRSVTVGVKQTMMLFRRISVAVGW